MKPIKPPCVNNLFYYPLAASSRCSGGDGISDASVGNGNGGGDGVKPKGVVGGEMTPPTIHRQELQEPPSCKEEQEGVPLLGPGGMSNYVVVHVYVLSVHLLFYFCLLFTVY